MFEEENCNQFFFFSTMLNSRSSALGEYNGLISYDTRGNRFPIKEIGRIRISGRYQRQKMDILQIM